MMATRPAMPARSLATKYAQACSLGLLWREERREGVCVILRVVVLLAVEFIRSECVELWKVVEFALAEEWCGIRVDVGCDVAVPAHRSAMEKKKKQTSSIV
jgi:hypothetical protein